MKPYTYIPLNPITDPDIIIDELTDATRDDVLRLAKSIRNNLNIKGFAKQRSVELALALVRIGAVKYLKDKLDKKDVI